MAENPATWNRATRVISDALAQAAKHQFDFGYSPARQVHDALEKEGSFTSHLVSQRPELRELAA